PRESCSGEERSDDLRRGHLRRAPQPGGRGDRALHQADRGHAPGARLPDVPGAPQPPGAATLLPLRAVRRREVTRGAPGDSALRGVRAAWAVPHHRETHAGHLDYAAAPGTASVRAVSLTLDVPEPEAERVEALLWDAGATGLEIRDREAPAMPGVR